MELVSRLGGVEERYEELARQLSNQQSVVNPREYKQLTQRYARLGKLVDIFRKLKKTHEQLRGVEQLLAENDTELAVLARQEREDLTREKSSLESRLITMLNEGGSGHDKGVILEIRAGAGGEEAALFAADLLRMYQRFSALRDWEFEVLSASDTGKGGYKEVIAAVEGASAYAHLKYESGVHRVQRVPVTESQGRIHTSTVTVAVLPEVDEVEVKIDPGELRLDTFRASGPGGQHVNKTDSAVRLTHVPTGIVVTCQDEKSQHKNKGRAMKILMARLYDLKQQEQKSEISRMRRSQVGTGERSEKIRTYHFPESRVTDHRIKLTLYDLKTFLDGEMAKIIVPLMEVDQNRVVEEQIQELSRA
ncbi:MAG: peptide chain release factor 1 [Nitrospirae bacterium]|nr:peptide chain release factor 1 [Nitrospirota bacterium]